MAISWLTYISILVFFLKYIRWVPALTSSPLAGSLLVKLVPFTFLERFWRISLHVTDDAIAKLYVT